MASREQNKLALVICYYLARFNTAAVEALGFTSFSNAFAEVGRILGVKPNYVKLSRDEFDPEFGWRRGWIRPATPQIRRIIELFEQTDEAELTTIVKEILSSGKNPAEDLTTELLPLLDLPVNKQMISSEFVFRGPTGKKAEEFFLQFYKEKQLPIPGSLIDTRDHGCGYDYKIIAEDSREYYVEVKGLAVDTGGILFTDKEWKTANLFGDRYFLIVIKSIDSIPSIQIIKNPALSLAPKRRLYTTLQIQWQIAKI